MNWDEIIKRYDKVSYSGMINWTDMSNDYAEIQSKLRGLLGAVGGLRNNMPRKVSEVMSRLDEIKEEINATEKLMNEMEKSYLHDAKENWERSMEDLE